MDGADHATPGFTCTQLRAVYSKSCDMNVTAGNKQVVSIFTYDHGRLVTNCKKLLRNLLAANFFVSKV